MIVVADTSPLNYLIQIRCDYLLPEIYERVVVPSGVMRELGHPAAPTAVGAWLMAVPSWVDVHSMISNPDITLSGLGVGEREAIQIAEEQRADLVLIDERKARLEASRRGLETTGTLGVLLAGGALGLIDPAPVYRRLIAETTFRTSAELEAEFLVRIRAV